MIFFYMLVTNLFLHQNFIKSADINSALIDSEISLIEIYYGSGLSLADKKYLVVCKNGNIERRIMITFHDGKKVEYRKKISRICYKKLWKILFKYNIFEMKSINRLKPGNAAESKLVSSMYKKFEERNPNPHLHKFFIRIKKASNSFEIFDIYSLKDEKFKEIINAIDKTFGLKRKDGFVVAYY